MTETTVPTTPAAVHRPTHDGPATWAMGSLFEHLLTAGESAGALGVSLVTMPPGVGTPLHRHTHEAEAFYLLEGTLTYRAGEDIHHLEPGSFIYLPLGVPHAFRITGTRPAQFLALTTPGGLMGLYDEVGIPARERRIPGPDGQPMDVEIARWNVVGPRYGLEVVGPPLPQEA
jgi:quercetin dioxygenase-like cupin family protein